VHEPVDFDVHRQAATAAFGKPLRPYYRMDEANVIVSLDCDFIGGEEDACLNIRRFAKGRKLDGPGDRMSRLYAVEALFTLTGANADHRLRVSAGAIQAVAARLAAEIARQGAGAAALAGLGGSLQPLAAGSEPHEKWIVECARDLRANG